MCTGHPRIYLERTQTRTPQYPTPAGVWVYTVPPTPLCGIKHRGIGLVGPQILEKYQLGTINEPFIGPDVSELCILRCKCLTEERQPLKFCFRLVQVSIGNGPQVPKLMCSDS
jgi:hypothetical protein